MADTIDPRVARVFDVLRQALRDEGIKFDDNGPVPDDVFVYIGDEDDPLVVTVQPLSEVG